MAVEPCLSTSICANPAVASLKNWCAAQLTVMPWKPVARAAPAPAGSRITPLSPPMPHRVALPPPPRRLWVVAAVCAATPACAAATEATTRVFQVPACPRSSKCPVISEALHWFRSSRSVCKLQPGVQRLSSGHGRDWAPPRCSLSRKIPKGTHPVSQPYDPS